MNSQKQQILDLVHSRFDEAKAYSFSFVNYIKEFCRGRKLCLFGAGGIGLSTYYRLKGKGLQVALFCDNKPQKINTEIVDGIRCVSADELLASHKDCCIIITVGQGREIMQQLCAGGRADAIHCAAPTIAYYGEVLNSISKEALYRNVQNLLAVVDDEKSLRIVHRTLAHALMAMEGQTTGFEYDDIYSPNQYLPDDIPVLRDQATYVDCGAYDGDTLRYMFDRPEGRRLARYYCYELDSTNYARLTASLEALPDDLRHKVVLKNFGVGEKAEQIKYDPTGSDTFASASGLCTGNLVALDEDLRDVAVGCIKMDIEGAEPYALRGASHLIQRHRPSLAICTYHSLEHLWELPLYIHDLVPEYTIRFRHHTRSMFETVCYATVE
ncbi:MAG: FkbM family methyltransferase [Desulfovibrio sp.]|uniref:FkbM family methyltransferase n=1 Tax=Desulfovibrio sp. TaxID=885 RepID=UPI00135D495F|nr:FkbM family methyltransferase [Desulfovibrio sp.]MTJ93215.1 FkbM family methyltransferase [Desulfovibrio sp.]